MLYVHSTDDTVSLDDTFSQQSLSGGTIYVARTADNHHITLVCHNHEVSHCSYVLMLI